MRIIGIDPGPEVSAFVVLEHGAITTHDKFENRILLMFLGHLVPEDTHLVVEQIACYGMAVGAEVFETVFWSGRFVEAFRGEWSRLKRLEIKMHLCRDSRAKDANIRQSIIDIFGGKEQAIGRKKSPGPLFGISGDEWSALAVALTWQDKYSEKSSICSEPNPQPGYGEGVEAKP